MRFEALREKLLRGGIAPRHVRRYLRELDEHLADLTEAQRAAGLNDTDAAIMARAQLGADEALALAMIEQRDFRSLSARFPWLVFGVTPVMVIALGLAAPVLLLVIMAKLGSALLGLRGVAEPLWFQLFAHGLLAAANFSVMPLTALLFTMIAWRQRLSSWWVLLALAMLAPLMLHAGVAFPTAAEAARQKGAAISLGLGLSSNGAGATNKEMAWLAAHYLLALLPFFWLLRQRALAKVPVLS